jgi:hypothetical protein
LPFDRNSVLSPGKYSLQARALSGSMGAGGKFQRTATMGHLKLVLTFLAFLTFPFNSVFAGNGAWTTDLRNDPLGNSAGYTIIAKDRSFLMGLTLYRDKVFVRRWPGPWSDCISFEVAGGPVLKIYCARDKDCERIIDNYVFVISGDNARAIIAALKQGTSVIIRDVLAKWELEPRGTFPLQGFKAAYDRAMSGHD